MKLRSPAVLFAIGVVGTIGLAVGVVLALLRTGDAKAVSDNAPLIAAVIALGGVGTAQMVSIALEDQRTQEARDLEAQRVREAALQNYFKAVGELLIEKPLHRASPGDNLSTVVRAQTLSVLEGLDPERKRILLLFLYESGLIHKDKPVVSLFAAQLRGANLSKAQLSGAYLNMANLDKVDLSGADLEDADLVGAYLNGADLKDADLRDADLIDANLRVARLSGAYLSEALLLGVDLRDADLRDADLSGAEVTDEKIAAALSLARATMPNGQKYEDWRKDR